MTLHPHWPPKSPHRQAAFSLLETLVAIGLLSGIIAISASALARFVSGVRHAEILGEITDLRRFVEARFSCDQTIGSQLQACERGGYVALYDSDCRATGKAMAEGGVVKQPYWIRATCRRAGSGHAVDIEFARKSTDGRDFLSDPLTGKAHEWKKLFRSPRTCAGGEDFRIANGYVAAKAYNAMFNDPPLASDVPYALLGDPASRDQICRRLGYRGARPGMRCQRIEDCYFQDADQGKYLVQRGGSYVLVRPADLQGNILGQTPHFGDSQIECTGGKPLPVCPQSRSEPRP